MHDTLRSGDVLAVWRLDRLGWSLKHLIELMGELEAERIGFQSVTESIDTTTPGGKLVFHIFGRLAGNKLPGPRSWRHQPDAPARRPAASRAGLSQRPSLARRVGMAGLLCPGIDAIARNRSILG